MHENVYLSVRIYAYYQNLSINIVLCHLCTKITHRLNRSGGLNYAQGFQDCYDNITPNVGDKI